jgi:NAD(P)-dependent dehydrogenase (short-subunit alcohol dehydrogenase family)
LKNAKVYLATPSSEKAASAIKRLKDETKKSAIFLHLNLADWRSVRTAAKTFLAQDRLRDLLFNNGCVSFFFTNTKLRDLSTGVIQQCAGTSTFLL